MDTHGMTVIEQNTMEAIQRIEQKTPNISPLNIRDLFAMSALQGLLSCSETHGGMTDFAVLSYGYADAMMEARKNGSK